MVCRGVGRRHNGKGSCRSLIATMPGYAVRQGNWLSMTQVRCGKDTLGKAGCQGVARKKVAADETLPFVRHSFSAITHPVRVVAMPVDGE